MGKGRRRLLQRLLVAVIRRDVAKSVDGRIGRAEGGDAGFYQQRARLFCRLTAHDTGQQGLVAVFACSCDGLGQCRHVHARLGGLDDQDAVDFGGARGGGQRSGKVFGRSVFRQINQIGQRGFGQQLWLQRLDAFLVEAPQLQAQIGGTVGRQHAGAASIGDDAQSVAHGLIA